MQLTSGRKRQTPTYITSYRDGRTHAAGNDCWIECGTSTADVNVCHLAARARFDRQIRRLKLDYCQAVLDARGLAGPRRSARD